MATISYIIQQLEATEANVEKLVTLIAELESLVPPNITFDDSSDKR